MMGYPPFPQPPYPHQPMGYPGMPYPQPMNFHPGPQMPPSGGSRTLWVGDMDEWMNEHWLQATFSLGVTVTDVKVIRQRPSGQHAGYGFVEFSNQFEAQHVLNTCNGMPIPQHPQGKLFRLNWASHGLSGKGVVGNMPHGDGSGMPEYSLFVGDLASDVTDYQLMMTFGSHYPSVKSAKVMIDPATGMSKGYGFVKFGDEDEKNRAMKEMNGVFISTRQVRCSQAQKKSEMQNINQERNHPDVIRAEDSGAYDPANTTIFVGGLDVTVNEHMLHHAFSGFGQLVYVRVPPGKACGFVQFADRTAAEAALREMQGYQINTCRLRVSWGRSNHNAKYQRQPIDAAKGKKQDGDKDTPKDIPEPVPVEGGPDAPPTSEQEDQANQTYMDQREHELAPQYLPPSTQGESGGDEE